MVGVSMFLSYFGFWFINQRNKSLLINSNFTVKNQWHSLLHHYWIIIVALLLAMMLRSASLKFPFLLYILVNACCQTKKTKCSVVGLWLRRFFCSLDVFVSHSSEQRERRRVAFQQCHFSGLSSQ
jgi:hypothetical protein